MAKKIWTERDEAIARLNANKGVDDKITLFLAKDIPGAMEALQSNDVQSAVDALGREIEYNNQFITDEFKPKVKFTPAEAQAEIERRKNANRPQ